MKRNCSLQINVAYSFMLLSVSVACNQGFLKISVNFFPFPNSGNGGWGLMPESKQKIVGRPLHLFHISSYILCYHRIALCHHNYFAFFLLSFFLDILLCILLSWHCCTTYVYLFARNCWGFTNHPRPPFWCNPCYNCWGCPMKEAHCDQ